MGYDIRNVIPEMIDEIDIFGNLSKVLTQEQFEILREKGIIVEYGHDGVIQNLKLRNLFTIKDVQKKIKEICNKKEGSYA